MRTVFREVESIDYTSLWFCEEIGKYGQIQRPVNGDVLFVYIGDDQQEHPLRRSAQDCELKFIGDDDA